MSNICDKSRGEPTHGGGDGASSLWSIQTTDLFVRGPGLDTPGRATLLFQSMLIAMVILHVIVQQLGLTE